MTIKDIARESGYSVSTVSRVLNHRSDVSPEAKEKIDRIVAEHNFVPNSNAKQLKQTLSKTVLLLVRGRYNLLFNNIVEEIQKAMEHTAYSMNVFFLDEDENEVETAISLSREHKPQGILFLGGNLQFFQKRFGEIHLPCVLVTNSAIELDFPNLSSVATDDMEAAKCAVSYLIDHGHVHIGILGGKRAASRTSERRYLGCKKSFEEHGLEFREDTCYFQSRYSLENAYDETLKMLKTVKPLTAIFAMSDMMAIGAIRAIIDYGLRVPEDVSVFGFDGIQMAEYYNPKLSTIRQQYCLMARESVKILLDAIDSGIPAVHKIIPFELIDGESVKKI
ncbi:MAG: LacI family DNA-binding transcriptional regulator [Roseburia sp.]